MYMIIYKQERKLCIFQKEKLVYTCAIALGKEPIGAKRLEGDFRTPEGKYTICLVKEKGKYGKSLGLNYPNEKDAYNALEKGVIDQQTCDVIVTACAQKRRPPWGTVLGGEIYLHEGDIQSDWTAGCIALTHEAMEQVFSYHLKETIQEVIIVP